MAQLAAHYGWTPDVIADLSFDQIQLYLNEGKPARVGVPLKGGEDGIRQALQEVRRLRNGQIGLG